MQDLKAEVEVADEAQRQLRHHDYKMTAQVGAQHISLTPFGSLCCTQLQCCSRRLKQMCTTCPTTSR